MLRKITYYIATIFIVTSNLFPQSFKLSFMGRFTGSFLMSPSTYTHGFSPCSIITEHFNFSPEDDCLSIFILPQQIQNIDTLEIDFKIGNFDYSDTSLYQVYFSDSFVYHPDSLSYESWTSDIVGVKIKILDFNTHDNDTIKINLTNIDWSQFDPITFYFNTNIPMGSAGWQPLGVGNLWQYKVNNLDTLSHLEHYEVVDSVRLNDTLFYLINRKIYKNGVWCEKGVDSVLINSNNNTVFKTGETYWTNFNLIPLGYAFLDVIYSFFTASLVCQMEVTDNFPGIEFYFTYIYGIGLIDDYYDDCTDDTVNGVYKKLSAAKINGIVYGNIVTNLVSEGEPLKLENFTLNDPYPNPFNNYTNFKGHVPEEGKLVLSIFNILGQKVYQRSIDRIYAGDFHIRLELSQHLSTGVYHYVVNYRNHKENFINTGKIVYLK